MYPFAHRQCSRKAHCLAFAHQRHPPNSSSSSHLRGRPRASSNKKVTVPTRLQAVDRSTQASTSQPTLPSSRPIKPSIRRRQSQFELEEAEALRASKTQKTKTTRGRGRGRGRGVASRSSSSTNASKTTGPSSQALTMISETGQVEEVVPATQLT